MASLPEASLACSVPTKFLTVHLTLATNLHGAPKKMVYVQVQQMLAYSRLLGLDATTQPQRVLILAIVSKRLFSHRTGLLFWFT